MNRQEYIVYHQKRTSNQLEVTRLKNSDYCGKGGADDPFANLRLCEKLGICSTETGIMTRLTDKLARVNSFIQMGTLLVKDESVIDTIDDACNYLILLAGYIESKKFEAAKEVGA